MGMGKECLGWERGMIRSRDLMFLSTILSCITTASSNDSKLFFFLAGMYESVCMHIQMGFG